MRKTGLVLEGGAFRGLFTAGVLDCLAEKQIDFPYIVGVSSGAVNAVGYLSGQAGQMRRVVAGGAAADGFSQTLTPERDPVGALFEYSTRFAPYDIDHFLETESECEFVLTCCESGEAAYVRPGGDESAVTEACRAACAVPLLCQPVKIGGVPYVDGGVSDPIPVAHALGKCDRAVVVLTRREGEEPTDYARMAFLVEICYREKYPKLADALLARAKNYRKEQKALAQLEKQGKVFVIRPTLPSIRHFESDRTRTEEFYRHGYESMQARWDDLQDFLEVDA